MGLYKITELEDSDEENGYDHWYDDDAWEDGDFQADINAKYPGWNLVKLHGFSASNFISIDSWLVDHVKYGNYERVGWSSGCSYSVGVVFESGKDAMMFKLRWR